MLTEKVKKKFKPYGSQAAFRRFAASRGHVVKAPMICRWLKGDATSSPLDGLAKEWPGMTGPQNGAPVAVAAGGPRVE